MVRQPRKGLPIAGIIILAAVLVTVSRGQESFSSHVQGAERGLKAPEVPLSFEENRGQMDPAVRFVARMNGFALWLGDGDAVLTVRASGRGRAARSKPDKADLTETVRLHFRGSETNPAIAGEERLPGKVNYFVGNDPARWKSGITTFARVRYKGLYPGVDLVYYGCGGKLEYDFEVAPGADPMSIRMRFEGARRVRILAGGDLVVAGARGAVRMQAPTSYQDFDGRRVRVHGGFRRLDRETVGFAMGAYNRKQTLVIDPLLTYATLLGGTGACPNDCYGMSWGAAITADAEGNAYVTGSTQASDFPVSPGAYQKTNRQGYDSTEGNPVGWGNVFVTKLNPHGTEILYSTYLGGTSAALGGDQPYAIAVDSAGNAYVAGEAVSPDFPTTKGALQAHRLTPEYQDEGFVAKLSPDGGKLIYSTFIGGSQGGDVYGIAIDTAGSAYITGGLTGPDRFKTTPGSFMPTWGETSVPVQPGFVAKLSPGGTVFEYSTFLGGKSGVNVGYGIAVDGYGDAYVAGLTSAWNFPVTPGAYQNTNLTLGNGTGFVTKLNSKGSALVYSTYLGGSWNDWVRAIAIDGKGNAYLTGATASSDFPVTVDAFEQVGPATLFPTPVANAFVTKLNAAGSALEYSTYLGGSAGGDFTLVGDIGYSIAVNASGEAVVGGNTYSFDFPVTQNAFQRDNYGGEAAFLTEINPTGTGLIYSTFISGRLNGESDLGAGAALDAKGNAYVVGSTESTQFPTTAGAFETTLQAPEDAFVVKFNLATSQNPPIVATPVIKLVPAHFPTIQTVTMTDATPGASIYYMPDGLYPTSPYWIMYTGPIKLEVPAKMRAIAVKAGWQDSSLASADYDVVLTASAPVFNPRGGAYTAPVILKLTDATPDPLTRIFYTTNGAAPKPASAEYTQPLVLNQTTTVKAIAIDMDGLYNPSGVVTQTYTMTGQPAAPPTFHPSAGNYSTKQSVKLSSTTPGAVIYFTTDGKTPGASSTQYKTPISVSAPGETIRAIASASGYVNSAVSSATYTILAAPAAVTDAATMIGSSAATLNATVEDRGSPAKVRFEWGTYPTKLTNTTSQTAVPAGKVSTPVAIAISGLANKRTYYFKAVVSTAGGTSSGATQSFVTE